MRGRSGHSKGSVNTITTGWIWPTTDSCVLAQLDPSDTLLGQQRERRLPTANGPMFDGFP